MLLCGRDERGSSGADLQSNHPIIRVGRYGDFLD
jgi:hypothetical protein